MMRHVLVLWVAYYSMKIHIWPRMIAVAFSAIARRAFFGTIIPPKAKGATFIFESNLIEYWSPYTHSLTKKGGCENVICSQSESWGYKWSWAIINWYLREQSSILLRSWQSLFHSETLLSWVMNFISEKTHTRDRVALRRIDPSFFVPILCAKYEHRTVSCACSSSCTNPLRIVFRFDSTTPSSFRLSLNVCTCTDPHVPFVKYKISICIWFMKIHNIYMYMPP